MENLSFVTENVFYPSRFVAITSSAPTSAGRSLPAVFWWSTFLVLALLLLALYLSLKTRKEENIEAHSRP